MSAPFIVCNGVRQGSIVSPFLFNVYMDYLSNQLNGCGTGCIIVRTVINHLVIFYPYSAGLQQLLSICSRYGSDFDIKFNVKKSNITIVRIREDRKLTFPDFSLSGSVIKVCNESKYLGHYITDDLSGDRDMYRQCCTLYGQYVDSQILYVLRICEDNTF